MLYGFFFSVLYLVFEGFAEQSVIIFFSLLLMSSQIWIIFCVMRNLWLDLNRMEDKEGEVEREGEIREGLLSCRNNWA